ncbi:MAG: hypothetical protein CMP14_08430 [Rickettsiales bacterium]|nr:hypothetical protein [Rickettsiales bacterium]|tara:strand:+ start:731 stop:3325 length:2595 start_codon:yes stop_codon:yes gene_type:complete
MTWLIALALTFLSAPVLADPISIAIAAATSAASTAMAVQAGTIVAAKAFSYFVTSFVLQVGLAFLSSALAPKPRGGPGGRFDAGYEVAGIGPAQDHAIIYGQTRCGGVVVYKEATDENKYLHLIIAIAGHECEEITSVYMNDEVLTLDGSGNATAPSKYNGLIRVIKHLGTDAQTADATLIAESDGKWTSDHRLQGVCYAYIRLQFDADAFPNGEPSISFLVKGKKVYNPNTAATAWSDNAALCLRDYLTSSYGLNTDDLDETLFGTAANICDETVTLAAGGTEKRYTCNGSFTTKDTPRGLIDSLLTSLGGTIWYAQGKWRLKAAAYTTPLVAFTEDDLRSSIKINTRHSRRDNFNTVKGVFKGAETNYQASDYPQVTSATFVDIDGGDESVINLDLPFTSTSTRAQRIAKMALYRNREQLTVSASFGLAAFQVQVGDLIKLTNTRAGWTEKVFEVNNWSFKPEVDQTLTVDMDLREISSGVFSWDAEESAFDQNNTTLPDAFDVPSVGLVVSSDARIINEHLINVISATTTSASPERVDQVEVQFKKSSDSSWRSAGFGEIGITEIIDVEDATFDVRARAINTFGIKGDWTTRANFVVENLADPPANVTDFSFNVSSAGILLEWEAVADLDLSFYRIRHSFVESGATYGSSITAVDKVARPANSVLVPPQSGTYLIKAYDKSGNQSVAAASVVVRAEDLDTFGTTQRQTEHTAFSGTKSGCSVADNRLRITDPSSQPSTATYTFSNYIDTSAVRVAKCQMEIQNVRIDDSASVTFDTLTGNFDSLPGNFDDLSGGSGFTDTNVIQYVSTTDDNPASSPTWSAYKRFKSGDFSGRAFRFKVDLVSTGDDVTPALAQLAATVRY